MAYKVICPLMGGEPCVEDGAIKNGELVKCRFWINVIGKDPQTGVEINNHDCAIAWTPVLLIENSKINRETGAAVESMRNESVKATDKLVGVLYNTQPTFNSNIKEITND